MARVSNGILTVINIITLLISIFAILVSVWLYVKEGSPCESFIRLPIMIIGACLMVVSMMGLLGSCCRVSFFMWLYLITLFLMILGLMALTIFAVVVTNKSIGDALSGKKIGGTRLDSYSGWLQKFVQNGDNWGKIKSCLAHHAKICEKVAPGKDIEYYSTKLPILQAGCCKPPNTCGMEFKDATTWMMPNIGPSVPDPDCKTWSNDPSELCMSCESCKAASLDNIKKEWWILSIVNGCLIFFICLIYSISCCALSNNEMHGYRQQYYH